MHHPVFSQFQQHIVDSYEPEFVFNFLGIATRRSFVEGLMKNAGRKVVIPTKGTILPYPVFGEGYFEWIDVLESAIATDQQFVMIELGAGYGRWLVIAAIAVRKYHGDLPMKLIGVEAEPTHMQWMKDHFRDNGLDPEQHMLIEAAVDEKEGAVCFWIGDADAWYGQAIAHGMQPSERVQWVKAITLNQVMDGLDHVDLIDLDVQGAELVVLRSAIDELDKKVKRVHIGTHSRDIEYGLRELFRQHNWYKANDYCLGSREITPWGEIEFEDGVQTWINPRLVTVQATPSELGKMQTLLHTMEHQNARLYMETNALKDELQQAQQALQQTRTELQQAHTELQQAHTELQQVRTELQYVRGQGQQIIEKWQQTAQQLGQVQDELRHTQEQAQQALQQAHAELRQAHTELRQAHTELQYVRGQGQQIAEKWQQAAQQLGQVQEKLGQAQGRITAMESSKFWKLRRHWFQIKRLFGLGKNE
jgi:FkbM family methyltransferase